MRAVISITSILWFSILYIDNFKLNQENYWFDYA